MGLSLNALVDRNEAAQHNLRALGLGRRLRNAGRVLIADGDAEATATLPEEMEDTDYYVVATVVDDGNLAGVGGSMANSPSFVVVEVLTTTTFKVKLTARNGAPVDAAGGGAVLGVYVDWNVVGGRVKARS
tara:strand:+ start:327 stop:719 length:393 start_codon:yes stop_codon:yes gene_type:complete